MATKEQCDKYAAELTQRFEEFTRWAIANWPREDFPLLRSDFDAARRELGQIVGPKLGEPDDSDSDEARFGDAHRPGGERQGQFRDMNPMPWP